MSNLYRNKINKIYKKINKIAIKGRDRKKMYAEYINDLIDNGNYMAYCECLFLNYDIKIDRGESLNNEISRTWKIICDKTNSSFLSKLSKLYKSNDIYQKGHEIYLNDKKEDGSLSSILIGEIYEDVITKRNSGYLLKNKELAKFKQEYVTFLEVTREKCVCYEEGLESCGCVLYIENINEDISNENNLINRYKIAIDFLVSSLKTY